MLRISDEYPTVERVRPIELCYNVMETAGPAGNVRMLRPHNVSCERCEPQLDDYPENEELWCS